MGWIYISSTYEDLKEQREAVRDHPETFDLLARRLGTDRHAGARHAAARALATSFGDRPETFGLLRERLRTDFAGGVRQAAFEVLATSFSDRPETFDLLRKSARNDSDASVRGAAAASLMRGRKADGRYVVLLSRDLDALVPFLDPREPLPKIHIVRARERRGLDGRAIKRLVDGMTEMLGWDPRVGLPAPGSPPGTRPPRRGSRRR